MNISDFMAKKLYDLGFSYKYYQEHPQKGMTFFYKEGEYVIGGNTMTDLNAEEEDIVKNGTWLPSTEYLLEWLWDNDFVFVIENTDGFYEMRCKDAVTEQLYQAKTPTLEFTCASIIKKILKKKQRPFDYADKEKQIFPIIDE